mgnify:CR=1 FL=1
MVSAGELNRTVGIQSWSYDVDEAGGVIPEIAESWEQKAKVLKRSGAQQNNNAQQEWIVDFVVFVRKIKTIRENYTLTYNDERYTIRNVQVLEEGDQRFYQLAVSRTQTWQTASS